MLKNNVFSPICPDFAFRKKHPVLWGHVTEAGLLHHLPSHAHLHSPTSWPAYPQHITQHISQLSTQLLGSFNSLCHITTQHIYQLADWQLQLCVPPSQVSVQHWWLVYNGQHNYNVFSSTEGVFTNVWIDADEVGGQGDDDPEELLAHADDAADPGEEGQGGDVELRPRLLHLTVEVNEQAVSVLTRAAKDPSVFTITEKAPTMSSPGLKSLLTY